MFLLISNQCCTKKSNVSLSKVKTIVFTSLFTLPCQSADFNHMKQCARATVKRRMCSYNFLFTQELFKKN